MIHVYIFFSFQFFPLFIVYLRNLFYFRILFFFLVHFFQNFRSAYFFHTHKISGSASIPVEKKKKIFKWYFKVHISLGEFPKLSLAMVNTTLYAFSATSQSMGSGSEHGECNSPCKNKMFVRLNILKCYGTV